MRHSRFGVLILLVLLGCGEKPVAHILPLTISEPRVVSGGFSLELIGEIGLEIDSIGGYMFGGISDLAVDAEENLYVLDDKFKDVKKFDRSGVLINSIGLVMGQGPGEFMRVNRIAVTADGSHIFLKDRSRRLITQLSGDGKYISSRHVRRPYLELEVANDGRLFEIYMPMAVSKGSRLVHVYKNGTDEIASFANRQFDYDSLIQSGLRGGISSVLVDISDNYLVFAFGYPYRVQTWSLSGEMVANFGLDLSHFDQVIEFAGILAPGGVIGCVFIGGNDLVGVISHNSTNEQSSLDLFSPTGEHLGQQYFDDRYRGMMPSMPSCAITKSNRLFIELSLPFPRIEVFDLEVSATQRPRSNNRVN